MVNLIIVMNRKPKTRCHSYGERKSKLTGIIIYILQYEAGLTRTELNELN